MQFHKSIQTSNSEYPNNGVHHWLWTGQENKIELGIYTEKLLFSKYIYIDQKETFSKANKNFISDTTASTLRRFYEKGFLHERLVKEGIRCCQSIVFNLGYQDFVMDFDTFKQLQGDDTVQNIMIIPGCQHPGMLTGRVKKAVNSLEYFDKNLTIVATGCNPRKSKNDPKKVTIPDESKFILNKLNDFIKDLCIPTPPIFKKIEENKSTNTPQNIENTLNSLDKTKSHNLIIVSSTFHLIKLAKFVETELTKFYEKNKNCEHFIKNIFLLGAEKEEAKFTPEKSSGYIKSMFVDVYNELINYQKNEECKSELLHALNLNGYHLIKNGGTQAIHSITQCLGEVIQQKDICIEEDSTKRTNSNKRMRLHTDHPNADFVAWHCIEPSDNGGESRVSDLSIILDELDDNEKNILKETHLKNVQLFDTCKETHPIVEIQDGKLRLYFVPWFVLEPTDETVKNLISKIEDKAVGREIKFSLQKGDVLVLNNKRILHGRTEIVGSQNRLLKRYWIKETK